MKPLYKTTIVIWSAYDPEKSSMELEDLAHDATVGEAYCSKQKSERVEKPEENPDWDGTEFFGDEDD